MKAITRSFSSMDGQNDCEMAAGVLALLAANYAGAAAYYYLAGASGDVLTFAVHNGNLATLIEVGVFSVGKAVTEVAKRCRGDDQQHMHRD